MIFGRHSKHDAEMGNNVMATMPSADIYALRMNKNTLRREREKEEKRGLTSKEPTEFKV